MPKNIKFRFEGIEDKRVDIVIAEYCKKNSIPLTRSGIKSQNVKIYVNGKEEKPSYSLKRGDEISFQIPDPEPLELISAEVNFQTLYVDNHLSVINKPAGVVVHPSPGHITDTLVNGLIYTFKDKLSSIGGKERPGIVHRLDKDTYGLMIVALTDFAHQKLSEQFKSRNIKKIYHAIVKGHTQKEGVINLPIGRSPYNRKKMCVIESGRASITIYRTLQYFKDSSLVEIEIKTGRTHQIRVHFFHIGHPVLGDPLYSRDYKKYGLCGIALVSKRIGFIHPQTDEWMEFEIDYPEEIKKLIERLQSMKA